MKFIYVPYVYNPECIVVTVSLHLSVHHMITNVGFSTCIIMSEKKSEFWNILDLN